MAAKRNASGRVSCHFRCRVQWWGACIALTQATRSALIWLYSSRFRIQRASWRCQIITSKTSRQISAKTAAWVCKRLLQDWLRLKLFGSRSRRRRLHPTYALWWPFQALRNFWIECLSCNGDLVSKLKDQPEFCTLPHNVQTSDTLRRWPERKTTSAISQTTFYC